MQPCQGPCRWTMQGARTVGLVGLPRDGHVAVARFHVTTAGRLLSVNPHCPGDALRVTNDCCCMTSIQTSVIDPSLLVRATPGAYDVSTPPPAVASPPKRPLEDGGDVWPRKRTHTREEERKERLAARQQRNRESAQVSREKKKAHMEEMEQELYRLRDERPLLLAREQEATDKREALEYQVGELGSKVETLGKLLMQLVQVQKGAPSVSTEGNVWSDLAKVATKLSNDAGQGSLGESSTASAAPVVAPSSPVSTSLTTFHPTESTCLPAAEATYVQPEFTLPAHMARQRVLKNRLGWKNVKASTRTSCRHTRQPTAAALQRSSRTTIPCPASTVSLSAFTSPSYTPLSPNTGAPRMLRIRLRIPSERLNWALKQHMLRPMPL